jgi:hypothetical protein
MSSNILPHQVRRCCRVSLTDHTFYVQHIRSVSTYSLSEHQVSDCQCFPRMALRKQLDSQSLFSNYRGVRGNRPKNNFPIQPKTRKEGKLSMTISYSPDYLYHLYHLYLSFIKAAPSSSTARYSVEFRCSRTPPQILNRNRLQIMPSQKTRRDLLAYARCKRDPSFALSAIYTQPYLPSRSRQQK